MRTLPAGTCSKKEASPGFTLLELIVVVFIISLLAAAVLPSLSRLGAGDLKADTKKISSLVRYLNDSAVYSKQTYWLKFDLRERSISWNGPEGEKSEGYKTLAGVNLQSRGLIRDGQVTVFFGPLGLRENLDIFLNDREKEFSIMFNSLSGRVKIKSNEG